VYAVLSVNSGSSQGEIERDDLTSCFRWWYSLGQERERCEEMHKIIMRNLDLWELHWWVNLQFLIWKIQVIIQQQSTSIPGLLTPIRHVIPLISHIHLNRWYHSHRHLSALLLVHKSTVIAEQKVKSFLSISPCYDHKLTQSTAYSGYRIHPRSSVFPSYSRLCIDPSM